MIQEDPYRNCVFFFQVDSEYIEQSPYEKTAASLAISVMWLIVIGTVYFYFSG